EEANRVRVRGLLHVPDPGVEQLAGGAFEVLGGGPRAPLLGVRRAGDRVHDRRLAVAGLDVPGALEPLDLGSLPLASRSALRGAPRSSLAGAPRTSLALGPRNSLRSRPEGRGTADQVRIRTGACALLSASWPKLPAKQ